jgi:acetyltransferase
MDTPHPIDPSQNYLKLKSEPLDAMFHPKSIAIIGAKDDPGSVARTIQKNLIDGGFKGPLYPVNPKRDQVLGLKCYPHVPQEVDLAVIVAPAKAVPAIIKECVVAKTKACVIISAGFKEIGKEGEALEKQILELSAHLPIIGPNCLGIMNPYFNLNATFANGMANKGSIAFISQSGALLTAVLDYSFQENLGFSAIVSIGSMLDVNWGDLISYFGSDPNTKSILLYMETVGDPSAFLSAAREVALTKPIIVIKPGRTQAAAKAAASHTGSLVGNDAVFQAALERVGVLRVDTISQLFTMAEVLAKQPLPKGPNLAIITNAGGPATLATDAAILQGANIGPLSESTKKTLSSFLPSAWSHNNPIDILGDSKAVDYGRTVEVILGDSSFDGLLTILTPQDMTEPLESAQAMVSLVQKGQGKPLLCSWMGGKTVQSAKEVLNRANIATFSYPDQAAWSFAKMWQHHLNLQALNELPAKKEMVSPLSQQLKTERQEKAKAIKGDRETLLSEAESKALLNLYKIPTNETLKAKTADEAVECAKKIGYPVVLKLNSNTISHKSDVGGVKLDLKTDEEVCKAFDEIQRRVDAKDMDGVTVQKMVQRGGYELILGSSIDLQFGPVILFGGGGVLVELYKDTAIALPPLGPVLARQLMEKTKIYQALKGIRGRPAVDLNKLQDLLIRFSLLISENLWIKECDINPLLCSHEQIVALDARVVVNQSTVPKLSLRPYPVEYIFSETLKDGKNVIIRPVKPDDRPALVLFHERLSEHSVHMRYLNFLSLSERVARERLIRICLTDFTREFVLVAENRDQIVGVIRLSRIPSSFDANLFLVIEDLYQNKGLGTHLLQKALFIAQQEGVRHVFAEILEENKEMLSLCKKMGFTFETGGDVNTKIILASYFIS